MKDISALLVVGLVTTAWSLGAAEPDLTKLPPPAKKDGVTYTKDIRPLFEATCFRCHGSERQRGELRLDSLEAALKGGEDGKVITPGKSDQSPLVHAVARLDEKKAMPPKPQPGRGGPGGAGNRPPGGPDRKSDDGGNPQIRKEGTGPQAPGGPRGGGGPVSKSLTSEQVGLIRAWIDQGAK